jgi:prepilin-type N-terminal cleavage/methylation domain-containing protein
MLQQSNRLRCAFTIAEMLTVLAIIVLLMTLVLGAVSYVGTWQMKRQTEQTMVKALGHLDRWIEKIRN